jgi:hypothetical protein
MARQWTSSLYHFDGEPRSKGSVPFEVKASLPDILKAERTRLLHR